MARIELIINFKTEIMKRGITAALVKEKGGKFEIEKVALDNPKSGLN